MNRLLKFATIILVIAVGFSVGLFASSYYGVIGKLDPKPMAELFKADSCVAADTPIIMETAYTRCKHIVSTKYKGSDGLKGKSLQDIRKIFPEKKGYLVWFTDDGTLVIHRRVETWCPKDRNKVHLGVVKNHVAVYRGPGGINDEIMRITNVRIEVLPENLRRDLKAGIFEFTDEEEANFVLENLDEYE